MQKVIYSAAQEFSQLGVMRVLFPLLAVVGPLTLFYYGYLGVTRRKTLLLGRQPNKNLGPAITIEGTSAVVLGIIYIVVGILFAAFMLPFAGAMLALF